MPSPTPDFLAILRVLAAHKVDFIVVGGVCGVLHGAPIATFDLDIVHSREPENLDRLMRALSELQAHYRGQAGRRLMPDRSHLASPGHQLLMTEVGPLDLLGMLGAGRGYAQLAGTTTEITIGEIKILLLDLPTLIETKEAAGRDKDRAVLAILRRTLEERQRQDTSRP